MNSWSRGMSMGERLDGTNGMTCSIGKDLMLPRGQTSIVPHQAHQAEDKVSFVSKDRKEELKHLQPCRDFLHNRCFKGDKCIYSHDLEQIRHINTVQDGACMSFLFGVCELPLCRFKHDVAMVKRLVLTELAQESTASLVTKSGVCLEYLKGACTKDTVCPFSHALKDYYMHVCKRKPHACISKRPAVETLVSTLSHSRYSAGDMAARCKRSYMLRCLIPSILPGDQKRAEAVVAVLEAHPCIAAQLAPVYEDLLHAHQGMVGGEHS